MNRSIKRAALITLVIGVFTLSACQELFGTPVPIITPKATNNNPTRTLAAKQTEIPSATPTVKPSVMPTNTIVPSGPATCKIAPVLPVIDEKMDELIPDQTDYDWSLGPDNARITIIEYSDFQCVICANLALNLHQLQGRYPEDVRIIFRHLPLTEENDKAALAAQAAEAAGLQDQYWQMHDLLFTKQNEWNDLSVKEFSTWLLSEAAKLNLDVNQFEEDLSSDQVVTRVFEADALNADTGLTSPPAVFYNKNLYQGWVDLESLASMVEYYKMADTAFDNCPETVIDTSKQYTATFTTERGEFVVELYDDQAPMAVNNFVFLVRQNWYANSTFFRVIPGFVAQAGDPSNSGNGRPGYLFSNEVTPELRFNEPGMLAMTNYGEGTNGSQFFFTYAAIPEFDGLYTIFGKVIEGMDVVRSLRPRNPDQDNVLLSADSILSIIIEEK